MPGAIHAAGGVYVAPFHNATGNPSAGRAITDLTATTLAARGVPLVQSESAIARGYEMLEAGRERNFLQLAREVGATHAIIGTVHEYRFKSDLDGAPTVGLSLRLVESATGQTVWQGSSSRSSGYYGSLTGTAQGAIDQLVDEMGGKKRTRMVRTKTSHDSESYRQRSDEATTTVSRTPPKPPKPRVDYEQVRRRGGTVTTVETSTDSDTSSTGSSGSLNVPAPVVSADFPPPPPTTSSPLESRWTPVR